MENEKDYFKDFDCWNINKKKIDTNETRPLYFRKGQIWWVSCGLNVGIEINGKGSLFLRPFLVLQKNDSKSAICLPITKFKNKKRNYYFKIFIKDKKSLIVLSQIKNIDSKRFYKHYSEISNKKFKKIRKAFIEYIKSPSFRSGDMGNPNYA